MDLDNTQTSRLRMLAAAKSLFASKGYESTSTASIVRAAGTSESQLVRYFGGKSGLLEAIFNASWAEITPMIQQKALGATTGREALRILVEIFLDSFDKDHDLAVVFLFEGRRIRGEEDVLLSEGFARFREVIRLLVGRAKAEGSIRRDLQDGAIVSAIIGAAEGMIRDRLTAERIGETVPFAPKDVAEVMDAMIGGLGGSLPD